MNEKVNNSLDLLRDELMAGNIEMSKPGSEGWRDAESLAALTDGDYLFRAKPKGIGELYADVVDAALTLYVWGEAEHDGLPCVLLTEMSWKRLEDALDALD